MWSALTTILSVAVMTAIKELFSLLSRRPADQNATNEELEQHYQRAHIAETEARQIMLQAEELQRREEIAQMREEAAIQREQEALQREANALRREREANLAAEQARTAAREVNQRDQASRDREEEAKRREEEFRQLAEQIEQATLDAQKREEEANAREEEAKRREEEANTAASKAQEQEQEARNVLESALKGIQPEVWPTEEEFRSAKTRIQYDPEKLHFAVCGISGSGKSSLINAFRGLTNSDPGAAPTGIIETTMSVTRYPDPHDELPRSRFIWFDVPGAGTPDVPSWQYFNEQGLFVFDIVILVYDTRFTEIDVAIIQHCERYNIPVFLVRSKADILIKSILEDEFDYDESEKGAVKIYKRHHPAARQLLIDSTKKNLDKNLKKANLAERQVFIISKSSMHALMTEKWNWKKEANAIDEANLLQAVLKAAYSRRYGWRSSFYPQDHSAVVR